MRGLKRRRAFARTLLGVCAAQLMAIGAANGAPSEVRSAPAASTRTATESTSAGNLSVYEMMVGNPDWRPRTVKYSIFQPVGIHESTPVPLIINLHGGGGSEAQLRRWLPAIHELTEAGDIPAAIWTTPGAARSFYLNYRDGSEHWESILIEEYLPHLLATYDIDPSRVYLMGTSMGGMGALRLAFKYPERFTGVAALEPAIEATLRWEDMSPLDGFYRTDQYPEKFGEPVDPQYWAENHPPAIVANAPGRIRDANLAIYLECGDEDILNLYRGAEFLHRILFDEGIKHEYRLVRGANHIGNEFLNLRLRDAVRFIGRDINPIDDGLDDEPFIVRTKAATANMGPRVPIPSHRQDPGD